MTKMENFHFSRIAFAIVNGKFMFTMFDKRDHKTWLKSLVDISDEEYEDTIRGYMKDNRLVFYKSSKFEPVDLGGISLDALNHLSILALVYMNTSCVECYNGLNMGEAGEVWEPIEHIDSLNNMISCRKRLMDMAC